MVTGETEEEYFVGGRPKACGCLLTATTPEVRPAPTVRVRKVFISGLMAGGGRGFIQA
jgi:hypothetical protein